MDKAKAAVSNLLSKDGKHDTTVHEKVNAAVTNERVLPTQTEETQNVIDREVHQDHFHTSVQPIKQQEVLPEQHSHNMVGAETREHHHGNSEHIKQRLAEEAAQFKSTREVGETQRTTAEAPVVAGEHVHHHVYETIQPVVQKETIQPSVVHTTIPVHEIHHNEAKHHAGSALPAMTMAEFQNQGGVLGGREERSDAFAGEPRAVGGSLANSGNQTLGGPGASGTTSMTDGNVGRSGHTTGTGLGRTNEYDDTTTGRTTGVTGSKGLGRSNEYDNTTTGPGLGRTNEYNDTTAGTTSAAKKGGLLNKLNPNTDSNGDGKVGFMK